jgi:integrase
MTTKRTGTVEPIPGSNPRRYRGRLRLGDGTRGPRIPIPEPVCFDREAAVAYVRPLQALEDQKGLLLAKKRGAAPSGETVADWFGRYFRWRATRGFVVTKDVESRLRRLVIEPLGPKAMAAVTRDDAEDIVRRLDNAIGVRAAYYEQHDEEDEEDTGPKPGLSWKSALNSWSDVTRAFDEACNSKDRSMRVLAVDPTDKVRGPDRGVERDKPFLFPSELAALLSCKDVPAHWRRMYAVAAYTGGRANELVDLEHGRISITKQVDRNTGKLRPTKTKRTRTVDIEPALLPLVEALVEHAGEGRLLRMPPDEDRADMLRRHLRVAGCTREGLYADDAQRAPVRFHSLRDTSLTFMAIRGDEPLRIQWRAGHTSFAMTEKYIAQARRFEAGFGAPFAPLPSSLIDWPTDWPTEGTARVSTSRNRSATPTGIEPVLPT